MTPHLSEPGADRVEQVGVPRRRAGEHLPASGDHLQLRHGVAHHAERRGRATDAPDGQRAADGQLEVLGQDRRRQARRERRGQDVAPRRARLDAHPVGLDAPDLREGRHVDHDAVADLRPAPHRVPAALGGDLRAQRPGLPDRCRHVVGGPGQHDDSGGVVDEVPEVVRRRGAGGGVVAHLTARPRCRRDVTVHDESPPGRCGCLRQSSATGPPAPSQIPGRTAARSRNHEIGVRTAGRAGNRRRAGAALHHGRR